MENTYATKADVESIVERVVNKAVDDLSGVIRDLAHVVDQRFEAVDQRFDAMDQRFDRMDERFDRLETKVDKIDFRVGNLETEFKGSGRIIRKHSADIAELQATQGI